MALGKTIQIYLPDGNPRSIRIAEITSRTIQAILIPRAKLDDAAARDELQSVGIYFLIGNPDEETRPLLYVGEAEDCLVRLRQHNKGKDFWTQAIVIVSRTGYFTKSHIKYLEWFFIDEARKVARYRLENPTTPAQPYVPEPVQADLEDISDTIKILVSTLGHPIFDLISKPQKKDTLFCKGEGVSAEGEFRDEGFVVFAGSTCKVGETKTIGKWIASIRTKLLEEGILEEDGSVLKFTQDHIFSSPSAAAGAVLGRSANGWTLWKYADGKTLDEVKRQ